MFTQVVVDCILISSSNEWQQILTANDQISWRMKSTDTAKRSVPTKDE
jgi:hypothetical protein